VVERATSRSRMVRGAVSSTSLMGAAFEFASGDPECGGDGDTSST